MVLFLFQILSSFINADGAVLEEFYQNKIKQERKSRPCGVYCGPWTS